MNIKDEIYKRGFTIEKFCDHIGISRWTLMRIYNGENKPRGTTIYLIADGLKLPYEQVKEMLMRC